LFKNKETIRDLKASLLSKGLEQFEVAQLSNLCPETVDEVKYMIPSLKDKKSDTEIQRIVDEISAARVFQN
jgi:DNA-directed RNA polymerase II subunit RPB4